MTLDDEEEEEVVNRLSNEDEELLSFFLGVKQEPPHSCTLTTKLDLEPVVA